MASESEADAASERIEQGQPVVAGDGGTVESGEAESQPEERQGALEVDREAPHKSDQPVATEAAKSTVSVSLMRAIRAKPSWQIKLGDKRIVDKYKRQALEQGIPRRVVKESIKLLQIEVGYLEVEGESSKASTSASIPSRTEIPNRTVIGSEMQNLIDKVAASQPQVSTMLEESLETECHGVWHADNIVPRQLHDTLERCLDAIADLPEKDFHPKSNEQVQDLIHPSLFPYIEDVSPVYEDQEDLPAVSNVGPVSRLWSRGRQNEDSIYQWLPAQFEVEAGGSVHIRTYINNLEESNSELYRALELLFTLFLPMFEKLFSTWTPRTNGTLSPIPLRGRELQVIVKAANYIIQPNGAAYEGAWHVEGMSHENIAASGIYYYSTSPWLKDGGLEFRKFRDEEYDFPDTNSYHRTDFYSDSDREEDEAEKASRRAMYKKVTQPMEYNIHLGAVPTVQDRMLVFSNELQHKVRKLVNESGTQVGVRKILVFFLVDPDVEIVSTKHIPEQQWERKAPELLSLVSGECMRACGRRLPVEIGQEIVSRARFGMTMAEAKEIRLKIMAERSIQVRDDNNEWEREYALCEH